MIWPDSAALRAFVERDRELLASLADPVLAPCVSDPPAGPLIPPACPEGSPGGTPAPALLFGGCVASNPVDASIDYFLRSIDVSAPQHLYATVFHAGADGAGRPAEGDPDGDPER